jgi:hypothetical protein
MDVEQSFNALVIAMGGELVSELLQGSPAFKNADYLFRKDPKEAVVAELKCLTHDSSSKASEEKLGKLYARWAAKGLVSKPPAEGFRVNLRELPPVCQRDLWQWLGHYIKARIQKANTQIKETKIHLGLTTAKGLLLLANDGNYSLESDTVLSLADQALGNCHSSINSVIYFTANMAAAMPNVECDLNVWVSASRRATPPVSEDLLNALQRGWLAFFEKAIGQQVQTFRQGSIDQLRFKRPAKT